jgi:hypothetical protein
MPASAMCERLVEVVKLGELVGAVNEHVARLGSARGAPEECYRRNDDRAPCLSGSRRAMIRGVAEGNCSGRSWNVATELGAPEAVGQQECGLLIR